MLMSSTTSIVENLEFLSWELRPSIMGVESKSMGERQVLEV